jgi:hypothetical protein
MQRGVRVSCQRLLELPYHVFEETAIYISLAGVKGIL